MTQPSTFLVTGGATAVGMATCRLLAHQGTRIVFTDVNPAAATDIAHELAAETGSEVRSERLDVTSPKQVEVLASALEGEGWLVDRMLCAANIQRVGEAHGFRDELWRKTVDVNLNGAYWAARSFGSRMLQRGRGSVVLLSPSGTTPKGELRRNIAVGASGAAVAQLAAMLGAEWAPRGVRVNAVSGSFDHQTTAQETNVAPAAPEAVAAAIAFLLSDDASGIAGINLPVDGGTFSH